MRRKLMTINSTNAKITLDFEYESTDGEVNYKVKFHNTPELGDTISLCENNDEYTSFPAEMFVEIANFIIKKELIKTKSTEILEKPTKNKKTKRVSIESSLPVPNVEQQQDTPAEENEQEEIDFEEDNEPLQSFTGDSIEDITAGPEVEAVEPEISENNIELPVNDVTNDMLDEKKAQEMWKNREAAKESNPKSVIKRTKSG